MWSHFARRRWPRAVLVALALAWWPACAADEAAPDVAPVARLDFTLKDMNGQAVSLADFKGRPMLVNFWATWCPPCKAEIPWFVEFAEKYKDQNLAILGISTDDAADDVRAFAKEHKVNYPMLLGLGHDDLLESYDASFAVPVTWFIKRDGTVSAKAPGIHEKQWFEDQLKLIMSDAHD